MEVNTKKKDGGVIVEVSGEIDMRTSPSLRRELINLVNQKVPSIIVDMDNVSYIDSSGIATLVECLQELKKYNGTLKLTRVSTDVREVLEIARLDKVFTIET